MIIPIDYFDPNNGQDTTIVQRVQTLFANGIESVTITELEKNYTKDPSSQLELVNDVTLYNKLIRNNEQPTYKPNVAKRKSKYSWALTLVLCIIFGNLGVHRFYVGRIGTGFAQLFTFGGLGIWHFVDFIIILCGDFKDADGESITKG